MRVAKKKIKNAVLAAYWYPLRGLANSLPIPVMYRLAALMGDVYRSLARNHRQRFEGEWRFLAAHATPGQTLTQAVRGAFIQHFQNDFEMFRFGKMSSKNIDRFILCQGIEHLDLALREKRGVMLTFGHFGANKMVMAALGHRGYAMNQLSTPSTVWIEKRVDRDMRGMSGRDMELRWQADCRLPSKLIDIFGSLRPAYQCLQQGEILGVAIDGPGGKRKIVLDWNGHGATFSLGAMDLALRTNALVLPVYVIREPSGRNILMVEQRIDPQDYGGSDELTQAVVQRHASQVLQHPSFYLEFMVWRRFMQTIDGTGLFLDEESSTWQK
ncbi:MAG: hypothetical protein BWK76_09280 [Desulfobulbaceae bacterium A2]|nr:MAG: hypothetical protein BWK76_09280 [Desulfobulbaceae bacterium A2]